jgi:signal transduction histidine kinase
MKVKTRIAIGLALLLSIIIVGGSSLLIFQQNISTAADYHDKMSIPATNLVLNASEMFESVHSSAFEYVAGNEKAKQNYFKEKSALIAVVGEYENLIFEKNSDGKVMAPLMMQQSMQDFVSQKMESIDRTDSLTQELFSLYESEASTDQIQKQFNSINTENKIFHEISEKNFQMELGGKNLQEKIINQNITSSFISLAVSLILSGTVIGLLSLYISRNITGPLVKLESITKKISQGETGLQISVKGDYEICQLANSFNEMSKYLKKYQDEGLRRILAEKRSQDLEKLEKQKQEFISMITHELKSPLTPIIGFSEALMDPELLEELTPKQLDAVETILKNANRLESIIGDLLDSQRLDIEKMKFNYTKVDVAELTYSVTTNFNKEIESKKIQFIVNATPPMVITTDKQRVEQVLTNIVANSMDFVSMDTGKISVSAKLQKDHVLFTIQDNGSGIRPEEINIIFDSFSQIDTKLTRKHGGAGLGLAICRALVTRLGGKIWVESEFGKGSSFYFTIAQNADQMDKSE